MNYTLLIEILLVLIVLQVVFVIVLENRNPYKTVTWVLIFTFLPILGLLFYILFGEDYRKRQSIQKRLYSYLKEDDLLEFSLTSDEQPPATYRKLTDMLSTINQSALYGDNEIRFFSNGTDKFKQFFEDITNARHHIHILYYKFIDDKIGYALRDLLIRKAKEGLEVRLLYDDVGSLKTKKSFFNEMKKNGVEVEVFLSVRFPQIARSINYRNHKKLAVIDGSIGYVGGMNIEDCYIEGVSWGVWRDMQIRIFGKGAGGLQKLFFEDWYYTHKSLPAFSKAYYPEVETNGDNLLQIVSSGPIDPYSSIERGIFEAITNAKQNIYIQSPYFVPSEAILYALQTAAVAGIDVHVMMPQKSDNLFLDGANHSYVKDLLAYGIHVYLFNAGFIHSKCLVIDEELTIIGSANMDIRSFDLSFEADAFIYNKQSAKKAIEIFYADAADSIIIDNESWEKRSIGKRLFQSILRLFTPVL